MGKMDIFAVKATAKKIRRREIILRVSAVTAAISTLILFIFYGMIFFANNIGNFTVRIVEDGDEYAIALSEEPSFENRTTFLSSEVLEDMDNITESWIDENVDEIDGPHNGYNYIAYTFYVKNVGNKPYDYYTEIEILGVEKNADEAIRVKLYVNGQPTVYAKYQKDSFEPEPNTTPFYSTKLVMCQTRESFLADEIDKYTVVVWLEGNDPECIDDIKGGKVKLAMNFKIIDN